MKLAIFDLDGVLVNTHKIHTTALRSAVKHHVPHASNFDYLDAGDGVRTIEKLKRLQLELTLTDEVVNLIGEMKKRLTLIGLHFIPKNDVAIQAITLLKEHGVHIAVASNSRREFVEMILDKIGVAHLVDFTICGDEVDNPKPHPELFQTAAEHFSTMDAVVFEDSDIGVEAAKAASLSFVRVNPCILITLEQVKSCLG